MVANLTGVIHVDHVTISTDSYSNELQKYIGKRLKEVVPKEYMPICKIQEKIRFKSITYCLPKQPSLSKGKDCFCEYIIKPISKGIVDVFKYIIAVQYGIECINKYDEFSLDEKARIIRIFKEKWQVCLIYNDITNKDTQESKIINCISDQLKSQNTLNIDGWIRFRLLEYRQYIKELVENIAFEYIAYREYREFLAMLKQFVEVQKPMIDIIHIIPSTTGQIYLYDDNYNEITKSCIEQCEENTAVNNIEDLILSSLITIAPLKIVIHKKEMCSNTRLIATIQIIYQDKVRICHKCKNCNKLKVVTNK